MNTEMLQTRNNLPNYSFQNVANGFQIFANREPMQITNYDKTWKIALLVAAEHPAKAATSHGESLSDNLHVN